MKRRILAFLCLGFVPTCIFPLMTEAESLYAITDKRGSITFTTRKPPKDARYRLVSKQIGKYSTIRRGEQKRRVLGQKSRYDSLISHTAESFDMDPALIKAVVHAESSFNPNATSPKGAMGLMQLMPGTAERFAVKNAYEPRENLLGGIQYLRFLLKRFRGSIRLTLAAYNAGERTVEKYGGVPPYTETKQYVEKVLKFHQAYRCDYSGEKPCRG